METLLQITISLFILLPISYLLLNSVRNRRERKARTLRMKRGRERMKQIEQAEGRLKWN